LLPDIKYKVIDAKTISETEKEIEIEINVDDKKIVKKYENIEEKINDQKVVMLKTGLLEIFNKTGGTDFDSCG